MSASYARTDPKGSVRLSLEARRLLLRLLVLRVGFAPFAVLLEFDFALDELPILARPIVDARALRTADFNELVL